MSENVYRIGENITFPLRIEYSKASIVAKMPKDVREKLFRFLPEELDQRVALLSALGALGNLEQEARERLEEFLALER